MLSFIVRTDAQPRTKNGHPAHSTTGVASASWTQVDAPRGDRSCIDGNRCATHLQHDHRDGQSQPDPEPARHVGELRRSARHRP